MFCMNTVASHTDVNHLSDGMAWLHAHSEQQIWAIWFGCQMYYLYTTYILGRIKK